FHSIRPVGHTMRGNGIQYLPVEPAAAFGIIARLQRDHRLERFERLDRSLETDRSGLDAVLAGGLCDDGADQVVSQNMCPEFFPDQFRCLAAQHAHLHGFFERPQIQLDLPAIMPPKRETCSRPRLALRRACLSPLKPLPCYFTLRFFGAVNSV